MLKMNDILVLDDSKTTYCYCIENFNPSISTKIERFINKKCTFQDPPHLVKVVYRMRVVGSSSIVYPTLHNIHTFQKKIFFFKSFGLSSVGGRGYENKDVCYIG